MIKKIMLFICVMVLLLSQGGCIFLAAGAAGAGTAKWMSDKVMQEVDRPMAKVSEAVKDVFKDQKMKVVKQTVASEVTQLLAKYVDGRKVWVDVRVIDVGRSRIDVRVGWMSGNKDAQDLLKQIVQKAESWF